MNTQQIRVDDRGQTQVNYGDGWQDCSYEEFWELKLAGFELVCSETTN